MSRGVVRSAPSKHSVPASPLKHRNLAPKLLPQGARGPFHLRNPHQAESPNVIISPHISYAGDCQSAINLYVAAFDADIERLTTYAQAEQAVPPGMESRIAQAVLTLHDSSLILSDTLGHDPVPRAGNLSGLIVRATPAQVQQAREILLEEGEYLPTAGHGVGAMPIVTVVDVFGVTWQLAETTL